MGRRVYWYMKRRIWWTGSESLPSNGQSTTIITKISKVFLIQWCYTLFYFLVSQACLNKRRSLHLNHGTSCEFYSSPEFLWGRIRGYVFNYLKFKNTMNIPIFNFKNEGKHVNRWEMVVCFVDMVWFVDHQCLKLLFKIHNIMIFTDYCSWFSH
jgi:hypothetical protein